MVKRCSQCKLVICCEDNSLTRHEKTNGSVQFCFYRCSQIFDKQSDLSHPQRRTRGMYLYNLHFILPNTNTWVYLFVIYNFIRYCTNLTTANRASPKFTIRYVKHRIQFIRRGIQYIKHRRI
jgi:hypothetical protein